MLIITRIPSITTTRSLYRAKHLFPPHPPPPARRPSPSRSFATSPDTDLTIIHFNDVYDISPRTIEPIGGAARFAQAVASFAADTPLILFSGDCLNPSLLSAFTRGEQMVPILNAIGVHAAAIGNHDFDFGVETLRHHMQAWKFPWILSNVLDAQTHRPLADAHSRVILTWKGLKIGILGLVEREWLLTIPSIDCHKDIIYLDFVEEGRRLARLLHTQDHCDLVIALTHMRQPNDDILAASVPEIGLVLGGHDHDRALTVSPTTGTVVLKSGTDFREFSVVKLKIGGNSNTGSSNTGSSGNTTSTRIKSVEVMPVEVTSQWTPSPSVTAIVDIYQKLMGQRMDQPLGRSFVDIDTRFDRVRSQETNSGNLCGDIMRLALDADAAFLNGGTIRSDQIHAAGQLTMRDFVSMLPFTDELVVVRVTGQDVLAALETGVSSWPKREGRFLQVSGIRFAFDPTRPPGDRIVPGSVTIAGAALDGERHYTVATKAYLRSGKDGFDTLLSAEVVVDGETAPRLATLVHYLLSRIEDLNEAAGGEGRGGREGGRRLRPVEEAPEPPSPCAHGLDALYYYDEVTGQFGIAPQVEGRIVNVLNGESAELHSQQKPMTQMNQ